MRDRSDDDLHLRPEREDQRKGDGKKRERTSRGRGRQLRKGEGEKRSARARSPTPPRPSPRDRRDERDKSPALSSATEDEANRGRRVRFDERVETHAIERREEQGRVSGKVREEAVE